MPLELTPGATVYVEPPAIPVLFASPPGAPGSITGPAGPPGPVGPQGPAGSGSGGISETIVNAKGDLIAASAADTVVRLPVGSNGQVLKSNSATSTGLEWAAETAGGISPTIVDVKGDLIAGTASDTVARVPAGTVDGHVLTRSAAASTGMAWAAPSGGGGGIPESLFDAKGDLIVGGGDNTAIKHTAPTQDGLVLVADSISDTGLSWGSARHNIQDETTTLIDRPTIRFTGAGVTAADDSFNSMTLVTIPGSGGVTWDTDSNAANGVTKLNHSFTNLLPNSGMEHWINGTTSPPPPFTIGGGGPPSITRVASTTEGSYAARVTFVNLSDEFVQTYQVPTVGEWYTFTAVVRRVSGSGTLRMFILRHAFPFNNYFTLNNIPSGSTFHIVTITGQASFAELMRVGFQQDSANGVGSVWEFESLTLQKGKGVATSHTPAVVDESSTQTIYGSKTFAGGLTISTPYQTLSPVSGTNIFSVPRSGAYIVNITANDSTLSIQEGVGDTLSVVNLCIKMDSVGSKRFEFAPSTIAWDTGAEAPPSNGSQLPYSLAANSITYVRLTWMGTTSGYFGEIVNAIPPSYTLGPTQHTHTTNGGWGGVHTQNINYLLYIMRYVPAERVTWCLDALVRYFSAALRQRLSNNGFTFELCARWPTDGPRGSNWRGTASNNVGGFLSTDVNGYYGTALSIFGQSETTKAICHETCHAISYSYYNGANSADPHGLSAIENHPTLVTLHTDCLTDGGPAGRAEWFAELERNRRLLIMGDPVDQASLNSNTGLGTSTGTPASRVTRFNNYIASLSLV